VAAAQKQQVRRAGRRRRLPRASLLVRFGIVSFVLVALLGLVIAAVLRDAVRDRALADSVRTAEVVADVGVTPLLEPSDLQQDFVPLDVERTRRLDYRLGRAVSEDGVVRIKVWNLQHWIVWSDNVRLQGRWFPGDEEIDASFRGEITTELTDLSAPDQLEERDHGQLLAVYIPLRVGPDGRFTTSTDGEVIGSYELYFPYEPIAASIASDTRSLYVALAACLTVLYLALFRLVARASRTLRHQASENHHQATHDALTGLPNRVLFHDRADRAMAAAGRHGTGVAVLLADLDRFKEINDTLGHGHGDAVIQEVGRRIAARLRDSDTVARLGGDEFAVLLGDIRNPADAAAVAGDLAHALEEPFLVQGLELDVRASFGIACSPDDGDDPGTLLQRADVAMYIAKTSHSGCEVYRPDQDHYSAERLELAADVRRALDEDELILFYQPKVDLESGRATGVEALVRWQHPTRGLLGPGAFMSIIESTELMKPLTSRVLDLALAQSRKWRDAGLDLEIAVNVSARNVNDLRLPGEVAELLDRHGVPADRLELELTESALLEDPSRARRVLDDLHALGLTLAIDDFGTGYASLAYLTELPVGVLKIDQSFVRNLPHDLQSTAIVRFSVDLGRTLGLHVVGEGVETIEVADALRASGCNLGQGYLWARPMPPDGIPVWTAEHGVHAAPASAHDDPEPAGARSTR
jgi:diguanylate cyclase (GGDEF)-like protein